ncbi:Pentatricopeptide repeat-containing protein At1g80550, mitochondrial [Linum grandiflorum]
MLSSSAITHRRRFNRFPFLPQSTASSLSTAPTPYSPPPELRRRRLLPSMCSRSSSFNPTIGILGKFFEFDLSWRLIERMPNPDHSTFRVLFKRYVYAHLVQEALLAYQRLAEFEEEFVFCKKPKDEIAVVMANSTKIHNMILRGWFRMNWLGKCREFWEEMDRKGVEKDLHSYSIYMDILCKSGKPYKAVKLYKEMKKKGIRLDVLVDKVCWMKLGSMIKGCRRRQGCSKSSTPFFSFFFRANSGSGFSRVLDFIHWVTER